MEMSADDKQIRKWLGTDEAGQLLSRIAPAIRKKIKSNGLPLSILNLSAQSSDHEIDEVIQSELAIFILENRSRICEKIAPPEIDRGFILSHIFIKTLLDKSRSSAAHDGHRYYYKRFRDVLDKAEGFYLEIKQCKASKWSTYSRRPKNYKYDRLSQEDLDTIQWPPDLSCSGETKDIKSKTSLLRLAGWFWDRVVQLVGGKPIWIPLRDLVEWVGRFIPLSATQTVSIDDVPIAYSASPESKAVNLLSHQDPFFDRNAILQLAESVANQLDEKQARIYHLHFDEAMTLTEIANQMGLGSASAVTYHLKQAEAAIDAFINRQRSQSPENLEMRNDLERHFFAEALLKFLKTHTKKP